VEKLILGKDIFIGVDFDKCILHVPSGTRWAYRHHDVFKLFKNIVITGGKGAFPSPSEGGG
jgi:hypothetical protein